MKEKALFLVIINASLMLGSMDLRQEFETFLLSDFKNKEVQHPYKIWRSLISPKPSNLPTYQDKSVGINAVGWPILKNGHFSLFFSFIFLMDGEFQNQDLVLRMTYPLTKRYWKRRPQYTSNYYDAVFRGLG